MTLSLVLRARMSSEEFWLRTRKAYRERQKAKKNSFQTKEEYLASDFYKMKVARRARAEKWKDIDKNTFSWNTPTIALDLSYAEDMTEKVPDFTSHAPQVIDSLLWKSLLLLI